MRRYTGNEPCPGCGRLDGSNILKQLNEDKITLQKFEELRNLS